MLIEHADCGRFLWSACYRQSRRRSKKGNQTCVTLSVGFQTQHTPIHSHSTILQTAPRASLPRSSSLQLQMWMWRADSTPPVLLRIRQHFLSPHIMCTWILKNQSAEPRAGTHTLRNHRLRRCSETAVEKWCGAAGDTFELETIVWRGTGPPPDYLFVLSVCPVYLSATTGGSPTVIGERGE
ncbi:unnamed protein product [Scytosiphon promiscuus]